MPWGERRLPLHATFALALALALAAGAFPAPTASAAVLSTNDPAVTAPAFMGDAVVWAQEPRDGSAVVRRWVPGSRPQRFASIPAPRGRDDEVGIPDLSASAERLTVVRRDDHVIKPTSDAVVVTGTTTPLGGLPVRGPLVPLLPGCIAENARSATDGSTVALRVRLARCDGGPPTDRVVVIDGPGPPRTLHTVPSDGAVGRSDVRLAGPYAAWNSGDEITVVQRADGTPVARYGPADLGGPQLDDWDLDADGTIVAANRTQPACWYVCVHVRPPTPGPPRLITRRAAGDVSIAAGRIAFVTNERAGHGRLVVTDLDGRVLRRLDRTSRRRAVIGVTLEPGRIAWSVGLGDAAAASHWSNRGEIRTASL